MLPLAELVLPPPAVLVDSGLLEVPPHAATESIAAEAVRARTIFGRFIGASFW